ncbi:retinoblastoma-associated protein [Mantella aurantiaca]
MPPKSPRRGAASRIREEEKSPTEPAGNESGDPVFSSLCKQLNVSELLREPAWQTYKRLFSPDRSLDNMRKMESLGLCLYIAAIDTDEMTFTFTELVKAIDISVSKCFSLLKQMDININNLSIKVDNTVRKLKKKYETMCHLYQKFQSTFNDIFLNQPNTENASDSRHKAILEGSWTTFLLAKGKILQMDDDLIISFQLLLCVLEYFIKRSPSDILKDPYKTSVSGLSVNGPTRTSRRGQSRNTRTSRQSETDTRVIEALCKANECPVDEVKNVYFSSFVDFLNSTGISSMDGLPKVEVISKQYEEIYRKNKDIDARLFLANDASLKVDFSESLDQERTPRKHNAGDAPVIPPQTPVRAAMNTINQLMVTLNSASDEPSKILNAYFENCTINPKNKITERVDRLGQVFKTRFAAAIGQACAEIGYQRYKVGVRLHYRVLESILKSEEQRLSIHNFSKLLNNDIFHTCLLACAVEAVIAAYGGNPFRSQTNADTALSFPWILDVFEQKAFDFYKVIESFIRAEPSLRQHLERCEHMIMESLAWRSVSDLKPKLRLRHKTDSSSILGAPCSLSANGSGSSCTSTVGANVFSLKSYCLLLLVSHMLMSHSETIG